MYMQFYKHRSVFVFYVLIFTLSIASIGGALKVAFALSDSNLTREEASNTMTFNGYSEKYTFHYPDTWNVHETPNMSYVRLENINVRELNLLSKGERNQYFKIEVVELPANGLSLDEWVERQNIRSYWLSKILEKANLEISGHPAIYQLEQFGSLISPVFFIKKGGYVYIINPSNNDESHKPVIDDFLKSFKFN